MPEPTAAAVIVALPGATPTTLAVVLVAFLVIVTEAGTVTMPVGWQSGSPRYPQPRARTGSR